MQSAPQQQRVLIAGEILRPADDLRLQRQHCLQGDRQMTHLLEIGGFLRFVEPAPGLRQGECQQEQTGELGGEGLGRGDADLHAGARDVGQLALAHHGAGGDVADRQGLLHAQTAGVPERGQGVGRLA
ncbi:Uncharacterised protein [Streptococcus dysgalactiae subsp. equisimilis]|nr:Uncharacterised protein [Streptococcus dysgalactiae subsp. equisimilis]